MIMLKCRAYIYINTLYAMYAQTNSLVFVIFYYKYITLQSNDFFLPLKILSIYLSIQIQYKFDYNALMRTMTFIYSHCMHAK